MSTEVVSSLPGAISARRSCGGDSEGENEQSEEENETSKHLLSGSHLYFKD